MGYGKYMSISEILDGVETKDAKRVEGCSNTIRYTREDGVVCLRYTKTDVVTCKRGILTLNMGGWDTPTTRSRIDDELAHWKVKAFLYRDKGITYLRVGDYTSSESYAFYDGIKLWVKSGKVLGTQKSIQQEKRAKKEMKRLDRYMKVWKKYVEKNGYPEPEAGDPLVFAPQGELYPASYLHTHMKEGYVHGTLLYYMAMYYGLSKWHLKVWDSSYILQKLRSYIKKSLVAK